MAFGSLATGVSGLQANQLSLDVIGNNLANSNTPGYKAQRASFADLFYETLKGATGPTATLGGTNPIQTGFGVKVASIDSMLTQGSLDPTGNDLDLGIQGKGFFVLNNGTENMFTRAGGFAVDGNNYIVDPSTGFTLQRFGAVGEGSATTPAFQTSGDNRIKLPYGTGLAGKSTAAVTLQGNLSAGTAIGDTVNSGIQIFDSQGSGHVLSLVFTKTALDTWTVTGSIAAADGTLTDNQVGPITFKDDGSIASATDVSMTAQFTGISAAQTFTFAVGTVGGFDGITQFGGNSSAAAVSQNGYSAGTLTNVSVAKDGVMSGIFTNGQVVPIAQIAIANFANASGLTREGNNLFSVTSESGPALLGTGLSGSRGSVQQGTLEASNVDTALELTKLIIAQRGFQVNARTITVSNDVLQELATIIR